MTDPQKKTRKTRKTTGRKSDARNAIPAETAGIGILVKDGIHYIAIRGEWQETSGGRSMRLDSGFVQFKATGPNGQPLSGHFRLYEPKPAPKPEPKSAPKSAPKLPDGFGF
jgi:hypothetical protein